MAAGNPRRAPYHVYAVTLPVEVWNEPTIFVRQDQAEAMAAAIPGAEWYCCDLHMWDDGQRTIASMVERHG